MGDLPLLPEVFSILNALIEERCGLHYPLADLSLLASRISPRAREQGFDSLLDYYYFVRYDPRGSDELDQLIENLANRETYFFREAQQLKLLVDSYLAPMVGDGRRPRVWCAAAASGEEPYTLAMLLGERKLLGRVELVASDLSRYALALARDGVYRGRALRATEGTEAGRWLESRGETVQVLAAIREQIDWRRINLVDARQIETLGQFDAILCRNVFIYFRDQTTTRVLRQLTAALRDGGLLLVGAAESLIHFGSTLRCEERGEAFFYRKVA